MAFELNSPELKEKFEEYPKGLQRFLMVRERSSAEVRNYLIRSKFPGTEIEKLIKSLQDISILNDIRFTKNWVYSKLNLKFFGKIKIQEELMELGVDEEIIKTEISKITEDDSITIIIKKIQKMMNKKEMKDIKDWKKLFDKLIRDGFEEVIVKKAVKRLGSGLPESIGNSD